jgi:hypothetical protein
MCTPVRLPPGRVLAAKAVAHNIEYLEHRMTDLPKPPTNVADVILAQEIRQHIRSQKSPFDLATKSISDPRVLGAILNAPPFLSKLSENELNLVRERARIALHPEQAEMQRWLKKALEDLREGVAATKRAILGRCQIREVPELSDLNHQQIAPHEDQRRRSEDRKVEAV